MGTNGLNIHLSKSVYDQNKFSISFLDKRILRKKRCLEGFLGFLEKLLRFVRETKNLFSFDPLKVQNLEFDLSF